MYNSLGTACGRIRKFQGVSSLTVFVQDNFGGDDSRIYYIGLKGESKKVNACVYLALKRGVMRDLTNQLVCGLDVTVAPWRRRSRVREPAASRRPQSGPSRELQHAQLGR